MTRARAQHPVRPATVLQIRLTKTGLAATLAEMIFAVMLTDACAGPSGGASTSPNSTRAAKPASSPPVANAGGVQSSCTGKQARTIGSYSLILALQTDHGVWQLDVEVFSYKGPGTYTATPDASILGVDFINAERSSSWTSSPSDPLSLTVDATEEGGATSASLSLRNHVPALTTETVRGNWSCRTSP